ncbi:MAG TPA: permease [Chthoniobacteraceae bacterium]|jgi:hypothetical protein|nr:permease [Chthoniobacteraceae bacterium]
MPWFHFSPSDFALAFLSVLFEGIPFLLLGSLISGLVDVFVSSERLSRLLPRNPLAAVLLSGGLGLIFPMCECGSVIVIRRFIRKGLPLSCAVTYMLGAPIVSPVVALSTYAAFSGRNPWIMTSLRLGLGYAIAVIAGLIMARFDPAAILQPGMVADAPTKRSGLRFAAAPAATNGEARDFAEIAMEASFPKKLLLAVQSATADFLDVAFFFIIGCGIASVFNTAVNQQIIQVFATMPLPAILVMMALAAGLALCSTTDAFVAASFTAFPLSAKLAFLVFGPVFDLKLFWLYGLIFKRRVVVALSIALFVVIAFLCWQLSALNL